jgi:hypothetical protein
MGNDLLHKIRFKLIDVIIVIISLRVIKSVIVTELAQNNQISNIIITFPCVIQKRSIQNSQAPTISHILRYFASKLNSFTNFLMRLPAVLTNFHDSKVCLMRQCPLSAFYSIISPPHRKKIDKENHVLTLNRRLKNFVPPL